MSHGPPRRPHDPPAGPSTRSRLVTTLLTTAAQIQAEGDEAAAAAGTVTYVVETRDLIYDFGGHANSEKTIKDTDEHEEHCRSPSLGSVFAARALWAYETFFSYQRAVAALLPALV